MASSDGTSARRKAFQEWPARYGAAPDGGVDVAMSNSLWAMILIAGVFVGFMMGYSVPPMVEVGMIGGGDDAEIGLKSGVDADLEEYYRSLSVEEGQAE